MNILRSLFCLAVLSFAPLFGQVSTTTTPAPAAAPAVVAPVQTKSDAVLSFLLQKAEKYSGTMEESLGKAVDFAKENAEPTIREFLAWRFYQAVINGGIALAWLLFIAICLFLIYRVCKKYSDDTGGGIWVIGAVVTIFSIMFTIDLTDTITHNVLIMVQIHVAPRVYLIEEAMKLMKH